MNTYGWKSWWSKEREIISKAFIGINTLADNREFYFSLRASPVLPWDKCFILKSKESER